MFINKDTRSDKELYLDCHNNNPKIQYKAWLEFQRRYEQDTKKQIKNWLFKFSHDNAPYDSNIVDTLYNDVFIFVWRKWQKVEHENFKNIWFGIAKIKTRNYLKGKKYIDGWTDEDYLNMKKYAISTAELADWIDTPEHGLYNPELDSKHEAVERAVQQLSEQHQQILNFRKEKLSYEEISKLMNMSASNAKTTLHRIIKRLKGSILLLIAIFCLL